MVPQRGRPLWTPLAPPQRGTGEGEHPTGASPGRAGSRWVLRLLVRGLAAPPDLHMHRPTKFTSRLFIAGRCVHVRLSLPHALRRGATVFAP